MLGIEVRATLLQAYGWIALSVFAPFRNDNFVENVFSDAGF
jgi:hypothetical protein